MSDISPGLAAPDNREAVRKYRERKKARTEYLEGEVERLQAINGQLVKRLQGQTAMAAELRRLRGLLSDLQRTLNRELQPAPTLGALAHPGAACSLAGSRQGRSGKRLESWLLWR